MIRILCAWLARLTGKNIKDDQLVREPYLVVSATSPLDALQNPKIPELGEVHGNRYVTAIKAEHIEGMLWAVYCEYEPKYRPFANAEEFKPHHKRLIRSRDVANHYHIVTWFNDYGCFRDQSTYKDLLSYWVFDDDGSPCGVPME